MNSAKDGDKVSLVSLDGAFSWIGSVVVWAYKLIIQARCVFNVLNKCFRNFIVESEDSCFEVVFSECVVALCHATDKFFGLSRFDWYSLDVIGIIVIHEEQVFMTSGTGDWEPAGQICGDEVF